jgi:hypothetical protein
MNPPQLASSAIAQDRQRMLPPGPVLRACASILGLQRPGQLEVIAPTESWGLIPPLSLVTGASLCAASLANSPVLDNSAVSQLLFWGTTSFWLLLTICRLAERSVSQWERLGLLILASLGLYLLKLLGSPLGFSAFDEFLHWRTAEDIMSYGRLFTSNELLPVSPLYPGLEIVTTAIAKMTGLSIFVCAILLMAVLRVLLICALFLLFDRIMNSTRLSALACVVYMSNWNFVEFDAAFAYESLGLVFLVLALLAEAGSEAKGRESWMLAVAFIIALAPTHHVTALFTILFIALLSATSFLGRGAAGPRMTGTALLVTAAAAPWIWSHFMRIPLGSYLAPELASGLDDLYESLTTLTLARKPFAGSDGSGAPLWVRITALSAVSLVCAGLATGFFRTLALAGTRLSPGRFLPSPSWTNSRLAFLAILTLAYPFSMGLRLTEGGWELGNRLGPFMYLGIGPVVAVAVAGFWHGSVASRARAIAVGVALTVVMMGGVLSGWALGDVPQRYRVAADASSIEPMGIDASEWTRDWLAEGNNFASDRTNEILLATYGRQHLVTLEQSGLDVSGILFSKQLGPEELNTIKVTGLEYLMADLRLTEALPVIGVYFSKGEPAQAHETPPDPEALLKFNGLKEVGRPFDNGFIVIYDVRELMESLRNGRE